MKVTLESAFEWWVNSAQVQVAHHADPSHRGKSLVFAAPVVITAPKFLCEERCD